MSVLLFLLFFVAITCVKSGKHVEYPKDWPDEFLINFLSGITTEGNGANTIAGVMYYNWTAKVQRVDHAPGAVECKEFYKTDGGCTLIMNPDGMYRILSDPVPDNTPKCCLDMDSIHASPPNWATKSNPTYNGVVKDKYSGLLSFKWTFDNLNTPYNSHRRLQDKEPHMYFQTLENKQPLIFTFPGNYGTQDYHFEVDSMKSAPEELHNGDFDGVFDLPTDCDITCPSTV